MTNTPTTKNEATRSSDELEAQQEASSNMPSDYKAGNIKLSTTAEMTTDSPQQSLSQVIAEAKQLIKHTSQATGQPPSTFMEALSHTCDQLLDKFEEFTRVKRRLQLLPKEIHQHFMLLEGIVHQNETPVPGTEPLPEEHVERLWNEYESKKKGLAELREKLVKLDSEFGCYKAILNRAATILENTPSGAEAEVWLRAE